MSFRDWFLVGTRRPAEKGEARAAAEVPGSSEGVFLSAKSLLSFPVASGIVSIVWKLWQHFTPLVHDIVVLWISLAVGAVIFLIVISDPAARPRTSVAWIVSFALAVLNSLFLAASALGLVNDVLGGASPKT